MNVDDIQLRDLVVMLYAVGLFVAVSFPIVSGVVIWGFNRWLQKQDQHNEVTAETLSELKTITQVHEAEIENLKQAVFIVRYPKK